MPNLRQVAGFVVGIGSGVAGIRGAVGRKGDGGGR